MTTLTTSRPDTGAVAVPDITADAITQMLTDGGLRLLAQADDVSIIAERAIPGEPLVMRRVVLQRRSAVAWDCAVLCSYRAADRVLPHHHELVTRRTGFGTYRVLTVEDSDA